LKPTDGARGGAEEKATHRTTFYKIYMATHLDGKKKRGTAVEAFHSDLY